MATQILEPSVLPSGKPLPERRAERRQRVFKSGILCFDAGFGSRECVVRNLSDHGARLSFGDALAVPSHFVLKLSDWTDFRSVHVCWRRDGEMGVRFAD